MAIILPWCDVLAWRTCLTKAASNGDAPTLRMILCEHEGITASLDFKKEVCDEGGNKAVNAVSSMLASKKMAKVTDNEHWRSADERTYVVTSKNLRGPFYTATEDDLY